MRNSHSNSYFDSISDDENGKSKNHVQHLRNSSFTIMDMLSFGQLSQAIYIVAKFRIADYLKEVPKALKN